ncbi:MAG TPA: NAD(P)H-dependent oxidoreductase [Streptosporangiaceae bacterium]|nr:NAD(P)H-dependent oxidoreductase [Streptosporangiaceae bacterium]
MRILLISGSTRGGSGNTAALRTVQALAPDGVTAELYGGLAALPAFNPDDDHDPLPPAVGELRARIAAADAVLFCTPEYAGTLPGSLKNLLDWTVGGGEMYGKPVGWINVAAEGRGSGAAEHLAIVLGYVGTVAVQQACVRLPVPRDAVGADGIIGDPQIRAGLVSVASALAAHVSLHVSLPDPS